jgi:sugar phosphate isomerase/epimerase
MILSGQNRFWGDTIEESTRYWQDLGINHVMVKKTWDIHFFTPEGKIIEEEFRKLGRLQNEYGVEYHVHPYTIKLSDGYFLDSFSDATKDRFERAIRDLDRAVQENGLYPLITLHSPMLDYTGSNEKQSEEKAIGNAKDLFRNLDVRTPIDLETVNDPYAANDGWGFIGNKPRHFTEIIGKGKYTMCVDTGHLNMNSEPMTKFLELGIPVTSVHFHGNSCRSDEHVMPTKENLKNYSTIESFLKTYDGILVFEIRNAGYSKEDVLRLIENTKARRIA